MYSGARRENSRQGDQKSRNRGRSAGGMRNFNRGARSCPLEACKLDELDYKNLVLLRKFVSEYGRILQSRITSVSAKKQRVLAKAIKRARYLALLP